MIGFFNVNLSILCDVVVLSMPHTHGDPVSMDVYKVCSSIEPFQLDGEEYTVVARSDKDYLYRTLSCLLKFKATSSKHVCLKFQKLHIPLCSVKLQFFNSKDADQPKVEFSCNTEAKDMCSTGRYFSIKLKKKILDEVDYDFKITVYESNEMIQPDSLEGFMLSIGVIVAIIVGVVFLIVLVGVLCCCCCRSSCSQQGIVYRQPNQRQHLPETGQPAVGSVGNDAQPSAPPIYSDCLIQPPSYSDYYGNQQLALSQHLTETPPPPPYFNLEKQNAIC